jgi:hypothetical protein
MAVEIAQLKNYIFRRLPSKEMRNIIFFFFFFMFISTVFISDRRNRLIVYLNHGLLAQNYMLLQPFLMNPRNKCIEINQVFCSLSLWVDGKIIPNLSCKDDEG